MSLTYRFPRCNSLIIALLLVISASQLSSQSPNSIAPSGVRFLENRGQVVDTRGDLRPDILYTTGSAGVQVYLRKSGISYVYLKVDYDSSAPSGLYPEGIELPPHVKERLAASGDPSKLRIGTYRMDMELVGANPDPTIVHEKITDDHVNFYLRHCPNGLTDVRSYERIIYREIYPKIDLVFQGGEKGMKYDFVVHPGGRVEDIRMRYVGADRIEKNAMGSLEIENMLGRLEEGRPVSYQGGMLDAAVALAKGEGVAVVYEVQGKEIAFRIGTYDRSRDLVIDPTLVWGTYYGGSHYDYGWGGGGGGGWGLGAGMAVDLNGNITISGGTLSTDFPVTPGAFQQTHGGSSYLDAFLLSFNSNGGRRWATFVGGGNWDYGEGVACDSAGNVAMIGSTSSSNFPVTAGAFQGTLNTVNYQDLFIARFDSNGARRWSTYYGGSSYDWSAGCDIDPQGSIFVGGTTYSTNFPVTPNAYRTSLTGGADAFVVKMDSSGNRLWATYYGSSAYEWGGGLATDDSGNVYSTGTTYGTNFPTVGNVFQTAAPSPTNIGDAFITRFTGNGNLVWSTYLGGTSTDWGTDIGIDGARNVLVTGYTASANFPVTPNALQSSFNGGTYDAYLVSFDSAGNQNWGTYYGGSNWEYSTGINTAYNGHIFTIGWTQSTDLLKTTSNYQTNLQGGYDSYICEFDSTGAIQWDSYYGGNSWDWGNGITGDGNGSVIISGYTNSTNLPMRNAFQPALNRQGGSGWWYDAFIARFCNSLYPSPLIDGALSFCEGDSVILTAPAGYEIHRWIDLNNDPSRSVTIKQAGSYRLYVEDVGGCIGTSDPITVTVYPKPQPVPQIFGATVFCQGDSVTLDATNPGYVAYRWSTGDTTAQITVKDTGSYSVHVIDRNGCENTSAAVDIVVKPVPLRPNLPDTLWICPDSTGVIDAGTAYRWQWNDGVTTRTHPVTTEGRFWVQVFNDQNCSALSDTVVVKMYPRIVPAIKVEGPLLFCEGDSVVFDAGVGYRSYLWSNGRRTRKITVKDESIYTVTIVDSNGCSATSEPKKATQIQKAQPQITAIPSKSVCEGDSVLLSAGIGLYKSYRWSTGDTTAQIKVGQSGEYFVTITSLEGCPGGIDSMQVTINPRPVGTIIGPVTVCANGQGKYNVEVEKGLKYQWSISGDGSLQGRTDSSVAAVRWGGSGGGKLTVTITNPVTKCSTTTSIDVTIGTSLSLTIAADRTVLCPGDSVELDAGEYTQYSWSTGARTRKIFGKAGLPYTVTVSDADGCQGTSPPLTLSESPLPSPTVTPLGATSFCLGDSVVLDAGDGYASYQWSDGGSGRFVAVKDSGSYTVRVTNAAGCSGISQAVEVRINPKPLPVISGPSEVCQQSTTSYTVVDIPGSSFQWTVTGGTPVGSTTSSTLQVAWAGVGSGTIDIEQTSPAGCKAVVQGFTVTIGDRLKPTVIPSGEVKLCAGESIVLDAGSGYASYAWSSGENTQTITVTAAGSYAVFVRDASGCSGPSDSVYVTLHPLPVPVISSLGATTFIEGDSVVLDAGSYTSYQWSGGQKTRRIMVKQSGDYSVAVIDSNGCHGVSTVVAVTVTPKTPEVGVATAQLELPLLTAKPGARVVVPIVLKGANLSENGVSGYRMKLRYNRTLLAPVGSTPMGVIEGEDRVITLSGSLPTVGTGANLASLEFVAALGKVERTSLVLEEVEWTGADVQTTIINGEFVLDGLCRDGGTRLVDAEGSFGLKSVRPNPAVGRAEVEYETVESGRTQIWLTDMLGRRVLVVMDGTIVPGRYVVSFDVSSLGSGIYYLTLQTPTERVSTPIQVIE